MTKLPQFSREIRLRKRTAGMPQADNFTIEESVLRPSGDNEVLIRNRWFRVSISTRLMMSEEAETVKGIPFPPLKIGDTLADAAIGEVITAPKDSMLKAGDMVLHPCGWREYALIDQQNCIPAGRVPLNPAAWLGHGWTAYAALTRGIQIRPGDVVFVSSGAGAIGSMAGQIARLLGAAHVIGSTGSQEKAEWMKQTLHYDDVIIRGDEPVAEQLQRCAPDGIDVFVDIVGGEQLETAVSLAREGARFVLLGALSAELAADKSTMYAPAEIDSFALIVKGVTLRGYSADSNPEVFAEWVTRLAEPGWENLVFPASVLKGLAAAPQALADTCSGKARGLAIVEL